MDNALSLGLHACHAAIWEGMALNALELLSGLDQKSERCFYTAVVGAFSRTFTEWPSESRYCPTKKNTGRNGPPKPSLQVSGHDCMRQNETPQNKKNGGGERILGQLPPFLHVEWTLCSLLMLVLPILTFFPFLICLAPVFLPYTPHIL